MKIDKLKIIGRLPLIRERLASFAPDDCRLSFSDILGVCERRGLVLWNQEIVPELDVDCQCSFERELSKVGIRAGLAIPVIFANGYAYGLACHQMIEGDVLLRKQAASTCGLLYLVLGLLDHLYDEYPDTLASAMQLFDVEAIKRRAIERDLSDLASAGSVLANGIMQLYKVYFVHCYRLLDHGVNESTLQLWLEALCKMHALEKGSAERKISKVEPDKAFIEQSRQLTLESARGLALSVCLAESNESFSRLDAFVTDYATLLWYVDDIRDLEKDVQNDIWSALAVRLMLEADTEQEVDEVIFKIANEMGELVNSIYHFAGDIKWEEADDFSLADVFWADIWRWLGGDLKTGFESQRQAG